MAETAFKAKLFTDHVGRPRKLSSGAIIAITEDYAEGAKTSELAKIYGVSTTLIRTICYHTRVKK